MDTRCPSPHRMVVLLVLILAAQISLSAPPASAQTSDTSLTPASAQAALPPAAPQARITQRIDESTRTVLHGNVHPLARPQYDQGALSDAAPMNRILLLLQRSPDQEQALQQLLEDQQSKSSPNYHVWLTPQQFGQQFGPADADIQAVTRWLGSHGFWGMQLGPGRTTIEFSGNAAQVRDAFHTEIHRFLIDGKEQTANVGDPQIPAALAPVVAGPVSLNNFPKKSYARVLGQFRRTISKSGLQPLFTFPNPFGSGNFYGLGPGDFATIYNTKPLLAGGNDGTGQTIAVVGQTNLKLQDVQQFRSMFGLPANFSATNIILNGEDPGITSTTEESEADLDVEWSGAVAPGATIQFVVSASTPASAGVDLSALYIIEHNLAGVMSVSYGACERALGSAGNAFYNNLWQQAAAQGITVVVSSGDGGSAGCDDFNVPQPAAQGLAVSGFASTPYNVSVGGTDFDQVNTWATYWNATNDVTGTSAKTYIPEIPWNENCAQIGLTGCGASAPSGSVNIVGGGGGPSSVYGKPMWQLGVTGMPNDNSRDQPDVSLFASSGFDGTAYVYCQSDQTLSSAAVCNLNSGTFDFGLIGGTSASAPAFAGIMALVNQKQAALGKSPRQGNANNVLYALAKTSGVFNDVTKGNSSLPTGQPGVGTNSVPCQGGSPNCSVSITSGTGVLVDPAHPTTEAWTATAGYDMTTGLGSVNANGLANSWANVSNIGTTTTLTLAPTTGIPHGTTQTVTVTISVKANTGTGVPTGDVSLIATLSSGSTQAADHFTLTNGGVSGAKTQSLPGGTYNVTAHYAGDGVNAPSDSAPVQVAVNTEASKTFIVMPSFDANGNLVNPNATSMVYGTSAIIRMYVTNASATPNATGPPSPLCATVNQMTCPSGTVALTDSGTPVDAGSYSLNNAGYTRDLQSLLPGGVHNLVARYSGDNSYTASTSATDTVAITPAPSQNQISVPQLAIIGQSYRTQATVTIPVYRGVAPTGTFTFYDGSSVLPGQVTTTAFAGSSTSYPTISGYITTTLSSPGIRNLTAVYSGDANYAPSTSQIGNVDAEYPVTVNVSVNQTNIQYGTPIYITGTAIANHASPQLSGFIYFSVPNTITSNTLTTDSNGNQILTTIATATLQYVTNAVQANFTGGSPNYADSSSNVVIVNVNIPDFSVTVPASPFVVTAWQSASTQISIVPASTNSSPVNLSCSGNLPAGYTCSVQPQMVNLVNGATATATLTISPVPAGQVIRSNLLGRKHAPFFPYGTNTLPSKPLWLAVGALTGFAAVALLLWSGRRVRLLVPSAAFIAACIFSLMLGCGGGSGSGATGTGNGSGSGGSGGGSGGPSAPFTTTTTVSTSAIRIPVNNAVAVTAKVTGQGNPTGPVLFFLGPASAQAPLISGTATATISPWIVGIFTLTATYTGDATNSGSTSAPVNEAVTGNTVMTVTGVTGTLYHTTNVTVTLQ